MKLYAVICFKQNGLSETEKVLTAKTDRGAERQAKKYMKTARFVSSDLVKLCWYRDTDGCQGALCTLKARGEKS